MDRGRRASEPSRHERIRGGGRGGAAPAAIIRRVEVRRGDAVLAGLVASAASGAPSTVWTVARGGDVFEGARAAGALLLPGERDERRLLLAAVPVHLVLSVGWALVLQALLPRGREPLYGTLGGLAIAAVDLGVIGRRIPVIRALEQPPQWLDHAAYGLTVGIVLRRQRRRRHG
jgi:hypothetical protein